MEFPVVRVRRLTLGALLWTVVACGDDKDPIAPGNGVETVEVVPATLFLDVGKL